jgi:IclR family pca regulon transcriptional regulator
MPTATSKSPSRTHEPAWSVPSLREPRYSQSLARGLAILTCFTPERPALGIADIADEQGMSRSTMHRYVTTLEVLGYLEQGTSRKYRLGLRVSDLGMSVLNSLGLREHSHPCLQALRERTRYTASLAVLDGTDVRYVGCAHGLRRGQHEIDLGLKPGSKLPAYCTALGRALLAHLPEDEQSERIARIESLAKRGPNTITSKSALRRELEQVLEAGLAVDDEELAAELYAIAAPVRDGDGRVVAAAGLAVPASTTSLEQLVSTLGPHLVSTADRISARLGYRRNDEQS